MQNKIFSQNLHEITESYEKVKKLKTFEERKHKLTDNIGNEEYKNQYKIVSGMYEDMKNDFDSIKQENCELFE